MHIEWCVRFFFLLLFIPCCCFNFILMCRFALSFASTVVTRIDARIERKWNCQPKLCAFFFFFFFQVCECRIEFVCRKCDAMQMDIWGETTECGNVAPKEKQNRTIFFCFWFSSNAFSPEISFRSINGREKSIEIAYLHTRDKKIWYFIHFFATILSTLLFFWFALSRSPRN